jgi:hypothetical protein
MEAPRAPVTEPAQAEAGNPPPRDFSTYMPTARATRIALSDAPTIDGDLSDSIWEKAEPITEFYQIDPDPGRPASERTVVRFLYDDNNLYVYIYCYDRRPDLVRSTSMNRDGNFGGDDTVRVYLDPLNTRRNGYQFVLNPLGGRLDQIIQNNSDFIREWNTIWAGQARRVADGWTAEMGIPFRDLSFDPAKTDWVLDFSREIRHLNQRVRWSSINPATLATDISRSGTLTGITGITQGLGLDVQLFGTMRYRFDWQDPQRETKSARVSGNAFYKITPQLTGTLTVNPDFSDAPLDLLQVNTTRFNLFLPETRLFFLQDAATFEFGGRGFATSNDYNYPAENGSPFFSRNLGLAGSFPVSLISGLKLSGDYAGFGIGALSVVTNGTGDTKHNQVLSVARVTRPIGHSKAGFFFTNGDPSGRSDNTLVGGDFQYLNSAWRPGKVLRSDVFYMRSMSSTRGDDDSFGAALYLPNEPFGLETRFKQLGTNFTPGLGFINRLGIRQIDGIMQYRRRDLGPRWIDVATSYYLVTDLSNQIQSRENGIWTGISFRTNDDIYVRGFNTYENVQTVFRVANRVPVPAGRYEWTNANLYFQTSPARPIFGRLDILCCSFYDGKYLRADLRLDMRPNAMFQLAPRYTYTYIDLPGGLLNIHAVSTDFIISFSPNMQMINQLQFDNISQRLALSLRYRWEYQPGQELFASVGQTGFLPEDRFVARSTQANIRLGHTFRY